MHSGDFVRDFALIMVAAAAALILFRLIRQPPILGYLLAGMLVGPFALQGRFVSDTETVSLVAEVGLVVLLFAIGVEFGWERIRKIGFRVVLIGAVEIAAMISLGYYLGRALVTCPPQTSPVERLDTGRIEGRQKCQEKDIARNRF